MIKVRKANDRGRTKIDWLDSRHSFSFGEYYDPAHMGFRSLRVINDDVVAPGTGFGTHPHRDMEIITYVVEGELEHKDSLGNGSVIRPGDAQRMSAGTGIRHSEFNPSPNERVRLLQIWILPERDGLVPSYEQHTFKPQELSGNLRLIAAHDARQSSVKVHQDVDLYAGRFAAGDRASLTLRPHRHAWVQVARGDFQLNDQHLAAGDGAAVNGETALQLRAEAPGEVLVFDLA